jgi:hypothetical protein
MFTVPGTIIQNLKYSYGKLVGRVFMDNKDNRALKNIPCWLRGQQ